MRARFVRLAVIAAGASLAACASGERISAAGDVRGLLVAIRDDDRPAFDAHIDRTALQAEMQWIIVERAKASGLGPEGAALGALASGPLSRAAATVVLRPDVFRAIADYYGYSPDRPLPGTFTLAAALTPVEGGKVCARDPKTKSCLLTFANEGGVWKLVSFDARRAGLSSSGYGR
jgi:hypothetical protein